MSINNLSPFYVPIGVVLGSVAANNIELATLGAIMGGAIGHSLEKRNYRLLPIACYLAMLEISAYFVSKQIQSSYCVTPESEFAFQSCGELIITYPFIDNFSNVIKLIVINHLLARN